MNEKDNIVHFQSKSNIACEGELALQSVTRSKIVFHLNKEWLRKAYDPHDALDEPRQSYLSTGANNEKLTYNFAYSYIILAATGTNFVRPRLKLSEHRYEQRNEETLILALVRTGM